MALYSAYGLRLDSEISFPELPPSSLLAPTISIRHGSVEFAPPPNAPARVLYKPLSATDVIVHYAGVGTALVRNGSSILWQPAPASDPLAVRLFLLQQGLGVALLQRGYLVLHASAAEIDGRAVAFCGPSGQGKSTMVAALCQAARASVLASRSVISDDVLALDVSSPHPMALPGLTRLKLTEEARAKMAPQIRGQHSIGDRRSKALCEINAARAEKPVALSEIYLLETGATLAFTAVPKARAAVELVRHTYGSRLLQAINLSSKHFVQTAALARQIPVTILSRPRDLSLLPEIIEHVRRRLPSPAPTVSESGVR